ncbi:MAG: helix-turn-helix transcriptional regulator [Selenomonadaceae bacterium]|nr:helix-turn-helix transcriptional regulator [Selenomonadaceae bacterium]
MTYAEALKRFRHEYNLTQKQIADTVKIFPQAYQVYEYGREPPLSMLHKLADAYNVSIDYLVGRSNTPTRLP